MVTMPHSACADEFKEQAVFRIEENRSRILRCLEILGEAELWQRPNAASNSIANLILHLDGNIRQYIQSSLGKQTDRRKRDEEFSATTGPSRIELMQMISETIREAVEVIRGLSPEDLLLTRTVQGFSMSGIGNILHVAEHLSYHTGQIAFHTKSLKDKDLGFYADHDLNQHNEP